MNKKLIIPGTIICIFIILALAYVFSPTEITFNLKTDNNTRDIIKLANDNQLLMIGLDFNHSMQIQNLTNSIEIKLNDQVLELKDELNKCMVANDYLKNENYKFNNDYVESYNCYIEEDEQLFGCLVEPILWSDNTITYVIRNNGINN